MTAKQAQELAPSYLRLPSDGATFRCNDCGKQKHHSEVIVPFTPDGKQHHVTCLSCIDEEWYSSAKHCGVFTSK